MFFKIKVIIKFKSLAKAFKVSSVVDKVTNYLNISYKAFLLYKKMYLRSWKKKLQHGFREKENNNSTQIFVLKIKKF